MIALADLKVRLVVSGTADDETLLGLEAAVVAWLQRETGRFFGATANVTEYVAGTGRASLWLVEHPNTIPTTLLERAYPGATSTTITASAANGYVLRNDGELLRKGGYTWTCGYEYEVTYSRGYTSTGAGNEISIAAPADVRQAVLAGVEAMYREHKRGSGGLKSETIGPYSYTVADSNGTDLCLIPIVKDVIESYSRSVAA